MTDTDAERAGGFGPALRWGASLLAVGVVERILIGLTYAPAPYGDSPSYMRLAEVLSKSWLSGYDGTRVPGYPTLLALLGRNPETVWVAQMALGIAISLMLYAIILRRTSRPSWAFAAGALYNLIGAQVLFEANLLSETLTTFFLVASALLFLSLYPERRFGHLLALSALLGLAASLAGMVRTLFYFLPVWLVPFVWLASGGSWRRRLAAVCTMSLPAVLLLGGWLAWVDGHYGMLSPTTMSGYNLVQHTGSYFDDLPDSEAVIRDTYIKFRDQRLADRGVQTNTIWDAIPELSQKTGLSFFALSAKLQELSIQLIITHPLRYARDVITGWINFWKAPVYWIPDLVHPAGLTRLYAAWGWLGRGISLLANAIFLVVSVLVVFSRRLRHRWAIDLWSVLIASTIWVSSIVQTLVDHGDNPRFLVPLQMFVVVCVLMVAYREVRARGVEPPVS
jgi:hypothetical protein